ncbi:MAG: PAS domain-containing protein, partial [Proteobacteria bacterium]|nr:PAS domain-containing protein [Pseudomonadota bacterium]
MISLNEILKQEREDELVRLRQQVAEYETIFNAATIYFWYKDTRNRFLRVNNAAAALDGYEPDFFEGKRCEDLYPKEQAEAFYKDDLQVINSGRPKLNNVELHTSLTTNETRSLKVSK